MQKEEFAFMDRVRDEWSHRREVGFFTEIVEQVRSHVVLKPVCPVCKREWKPKKFIYDPYANVERQVQKWVSSIMMRHFKKEHGFDEVMARRWRGGYEEVGIYRCQPCREEIDGALHAIGHFIAKHLKKVK